jgi:hypothetical protein
MKSIYIILMMIVTFFRELFHIPAARAANVQESLTVIIGRCVATFTAKLSGRSLSFGGDTFYNEEDLLGDITLDTERGKRHMAADGSRGVLILSIPRAGTREVKFLLGDSLDLLKHWGQAKIQTLFDFDFYYAYNTQSNEGARIHRHKNCYFTKMPLPGVGRDRGYVTAEISFEDVAEIDPLTDKEV